jgi:glycosyltransferase involved in cell wall biosynthesis
MKFVLHSDVDENSIRHSLGRPDYGYYFVLKAYQCALMELGSVELVQNPETEVDPIFENCAERGEACVFLSFAPPHKTPITLKCPTIPVIAWGFSNIPDEVWDDDPRNDWRFVLTKLGRAITLSSYAARAITAALGPDFPVRAIVPPVVERPSEAASNAPPNSEIDNVELAFRGTVIDSSTINLSADLLAPQIRPGAVQTEPPPRFDHLRSISPHRPAEQFHLPERMSEAASPEIFNKPSTETTLTPEARVTVSGIVYTSVLNPMEIHKNWVDLVTAFCWAFRDTSDATLILKMVHHDKTTYWSNLIQQLSQLSPFKCRVVALQGYLEDPEYERLISATSFYVNSSNCEGMCLPLMEFLTCGKPAIAPAHTALTDYIDDSIAFVLRASPALSVWPQDPRELLRTMCYRLDWESLLGAFRNSYRLAKDTPEHYSAMAVRARLKMQERYSISIFGQQIRQFLMMPAISALAAADEITIKNTSMAVSAELTGQTPK